MAVTQGEPLAIGGIHLGYRLGDLSRDGDRHRMAGADGRIQAGDAPGADAVRARRTGFPQDGS